jgi:hypothetical protein
MFWSWLHIVLIKCNKYADIEYNINYIKVFKKSRDDSSP